MRGLRVTDGRVEALRGIDLDIQRGQVVALIGANGAGKTTTLRALGIAHSPEGRRLFPLLSVADNLELGAFTRRRRHDIQAHLDAVYDRFPVLSQRRTQQAGTLSGGEHQQLALGRALMSRPRLLLLDEPSLGLARSWCRRSSRQSASCGPPGSRCCWSSRTPRPPWHWPTPRTCWRRAIAVSGTGAQLLRDERFRRAYLGEELA